MKFGLFHSVQWPPGSDQRDRYRQAIQEATYAEEQGFNSVWLTEHHFTEHGIVSDSLAVLGYLAAETAEVRLGTAVSVLPFHDPIRLAETAATIDVLSDGRLDLGVGRGYQAIEFDGFAVPIEERAARFDEAIDVMRRGWAASAPFTHEGRFWQFGEVNPQPKPVQQPHPPIWVATGADEQLRRCAREGWGVMIGQGSTLEVVGDTLKRYRQALADEGQPYDPSKVVLARALYVGADDATAWDEVESAYRFFLTRARELAASKGGAPLATNPFDTETLRASAVFGSASTCSSRIEDIRALGIENIIFFVHMARLEHGLIMRSLARFGEEILPAFQSVEAGRSA